MIKRAAKRLFVGRVALQPFWQLVYRASLLGMNIGADLNVTRSGELRAIDYVIRKLAGDEHEPVVFDVGANVGQWAEQLMSRVDRKVRLYCFEPAHMAYELLSQKLRGTRNLHLYNFGFGSNEESVTLYSDSDSSGLASIYPRRLEHFGINFSMTQKVELKRLDDFCDRAGIDHIDLLKLDVEGSEFQVLVGGARLIKSDKINFIQFEFGGCNIDARTFFRDFYYSLEPKYRIYRLLVDGMAPITRYGEVCENFLGTNYLAVSRRFQ